MLFKVSNFGDLETILTQSREYAKKDKSQPRNLDAAIINGKDDAVKVNSIEGQDIEYGM